MATTRKKSKTAGKTKKRKPVAVVKKTRKSKKIDTLKVFDPKTGNVIEEVTQTSVKEVPAIYDELVTGQKHWGAKSIKYRQRVIKKVRDYITDNIEDVAATIAKDNGKSSTEAIIAEVMPVIDLAHHWSKQAGKVLADEKIKITNPLLANKKSMMTYEAKGPVLVISPWNYPFSIPMGEILFALLAGNSVCLKSSSETPLVGLKIQEILRAAGIDKSVFQSVTGPGRTVGEAILNHRWAHISFTGSVGIGKHVMAKAAQHLTPVKMELGGKDPMVVCSDADLERAANGAVWGAFTNAGQTCAAIERVYVMNDIADKFIDLVVDKTNKLRSYLESPDSYEMGPVTVKSQYDLVIKHIREAVTKKASILTGGLPDKRTPGWYIPPTVITNVDHSFNLMNEETFGPTLAIMKVGSEEEAIELANDSEFGLTASVWTKSLKKGKALARQIEAGTVCVNDHLYTHGLKETPWMGLKDSGFGISHSRWGLEEMSQRKHINYDILPTKRNIWWYPYNKDLHEAMKGVATFATRRSIGGLMKVMKVFKKMFTNF